MTPAGLGIGSDRRISSVLYNIFRSWPCIGGGTKGFNGCMLPSGDSHSSLLISTLGPHNQVQEWTQSCPHDRRARLEID